MKKVQFSAQQIQAILKENERGTSATILARRHDLPLNTLYRWKKLYQQGLSKTEDALAYVNGLQQLLVEVSRVFMEAEFGLLDHRITEALRLVGEYCGVDRAYLFRLAHDLESLTNMHEWCAPGVDPTPPSAKNATREDCPNIIRRVMQHEMTSIAHVDELDAEWSREQAVFKAQGVQSFIIAPIIVDSLALGFIGFDSVQHQREWLDEEVRLLGISADLIGAALKREEVENALRTSRARLQRAEQMAGLGNWEWRIRENVFHVSDTFAQLQGCDNPNISLDELLTQYVHPDDLAEVHQRGRQARQSGVLSRFTCRIIHGHTDQTRWIEVQGVFEYADGNPVRMHGFFQDVTDKQMALHALKHNEKRYRSLVNNLREIVFEADTKGRWTFLNPAWEQLTGYAIEECLGERSMDYVYPDDKALNRQEFETMLCGEQDFCQHELRFVTRGGEPCWVEVHAQVKCDDDGGYIGISGTLRDITLQRQAEQKLVHMAQYDALTGLPNRWLALDRLKRDLLSSRRHQESVAVIFLDIDDFKKVNDTLGHDMGDQLLTAAAQRITNVIRNQDTVARLGGDEFLVILNRIRDRADVEPIVEHLVACFSKPFDLPGHALAQTASIGVAVSPDDGDSQKELLRNADMAMYKAKAIKGSAYYFYTDSLSKEAARRTSVEEALGHALENEELYPVFLPVIDLTSGQIVGAEALLRWHSPLLGLVPPADCVPVAERMGQMRHIGYFMMEQALSHAAAWRQQLGDAFCITLNISPRQFRDRALPERLLGLCESYDLPADAVVLELNENVLQAQREHTLESMDNLRARGIRFALDNFGTGHASLNYLREYHFDILKIDRQFIKNCVTDKREAELVSASLSFAAGLGIKTIAEGVETAEHLNFLKQRGCPLAQGFLFTEPLRAKAMTELAATGLPETLFA